MYSYIYDRKSKSLSKKVVLNLLSRLLTNSYILYKSTVRNSKSRLEFIKDVIDSLASESKAIVGDPVEPPSATKKLRHLPGRKERECVVCSDQKNNAHRRSRAVCSSCQKGVHALCFLKHKCLQLAFLLLYTCVHDFIDKSLSFVYLQGLHYS